MEVKFVSLFFLLKLTLFVNSFQPEFRWTHLSSVFILADIPCLRFYQSLPDFNPQLQGAWVERYLKSKTTYYVPNSIPETRRKTKMAEIPVLMWETNMQTNIRGLLKGQQGDSQKWPRLLKAPGEGFFPQSSVFTQQSMPSVPKPCRRRKPS